LIAILLMLILSYFIKLFLGVLIWLVSFWTSDISGFSYSAGVMIWFLSGVYFPINMLPKTLADLSYFFPFVYTIFVPIQFYLWKISLLEAIKWMWVEIIWLGVLYILIKIIWKRGLRRYEGVGI
jgi:ABC-2 type transport system permease protein